MNTFVHLADLIDYKYKCFIDFLSFLDLCIYLCISRRVVFLWTFSAIQDVHIIFGLNSITSCAIQMHLSN